MTLPVESVTVRVLDVSKPIVGYSLRTCWPGFSELTYCRRSTGLTTFALNSGLNVTFRSSGKLQSWMVIVLLEPLVEEARIMIGFGVSLVHFRSQTWDPLETTVASRPTG